MRASRATSAWLAQLRVALVSAALPAAVLAAACAGAIAQGQKQAPPPASQPAQIDRNGALILIRSMLTALDQANKTGNYTVLRDLGAPGFQAANSAARLAEIFAVQRNQNLDLSGILVLEPQLTMLPQTDSSGMMRMAGFFPSVPLQVNFELAFMPVQGRWRIFGIGLNVGSSSPAAPVTPVPSGAESADDKAPAKTPAAPAPKPNAAR